MMNSDTMLSQEAIDALLAGPASGAEEVHVPPVTTDEAIQAPVQPAEVVDVSETDFGDTDDGIVTLDKVIEVAGQAAEAEAAPVHDSISRIYQRIGYLEQALARISQLEAEVKRLKQDA